MNEAMVHIEEQLNILKRLKKKKDRVLAQSVLHGMCAAYIKMGKITNIQLDEVKRRADRYTEFTAKDF